MVLAHLPTRVPQMASPSRGLNRRAGIGHLCPTDLRKRRQGVWPRPYTARDLTRENASGEERVCDRTIDGSAKGRPRRTSARPARASRAREPVPGSSGMAPSACSRHTPGNSNFASPCSWSPVWRGAALPARHVAIVNARAAKSRRQVAAIELRVVPRARDRAHVDHALHSVSGEQTDELSNRSGRVPDCQDQARLASALSLHAGFHYE